MNAAPSLKEQIEQALDHLSAEQLAQLWEYIEQLENGTLPPLYTLHREAIDTGVKDLAEHHDDYLYQGAR